MAEWKAPRIHFPNQTTESERQLLRGSPPTLQVSREVPCCVTLIIQEYNTFQNKNKYSFKASHNVTYFVTPNFVSYVTLETNALS